MIPVLAGAYLVVALVLTAVLRRSEGARSAAQGSAS